MDRYNLFFILTVFLIAMGLGYFLRMSQVDDALATLTIREKSMKIKKQNAEIEHLLFNELKEQRK